MRFGGHETFAVRPNWLSRGLLMVDSTSIRRFDGIEVADSLGVGRNMARAIGHWLEATGLIARSGRDTPWIPTALGRVILAHDPYLQRRISWWALHAILVTRPPRAWTWHWFFNLFDRERFDRVTCLEALAHDLERHGERRPAAATLQRDVACLLQSYAVAMPAEPVDPEDATDCPFRALGLLVEHRDTGIFERRFGRRAVPPALLGLAHEDAHYAAAL